MRSPAILLRISFLAMLGLVAVTGGQPALAADGFKVVVNAANPARSLSRDQVARYFLKKTTSWPSGQPVAPVDQRSSSGVREAFSRHVLRKTIPEAIAYWQQQIFSGRGVPPVEKASDAEVLAAVASSELTIGYVSEGAEVGATRVVTLTD